MLYRVIISHNQSEHLAKFPICAPPTTVAVFDAYTDADAQCCHDLGIMPVIVPQSGNRGANRNAGMEYLLNGALLAPDDIIEFFDGDRFPKQYDVWTVNRLMRGHNLDVLLYSCAPDARMKTTFVPLEGATLVDTGTLCNPFYSCGFAMKFSAIDKVLRFNGGHLFEPRFTKWGCEDQYLGLVCAKLGLRVAITAEILLNGSVGGDSDFHPDYRESLQQYVDLIREKNLEIRNDPRPYEVLK